jgi:hypothetical protein
MLGGQASPGFANLRIERMCQPQLKLRQKGLEKTREVPMKQEGDVQGMVRPFRHRSRLSLLRVKAEARATAEGATEGPDD